MIAAGLCLMGGCFAQDETSRTVDTYWPAHSVHIAKDNLVIKVGEDDLTTPFWRDSGMQAGVMVENLNADTEKSILAYGLWGTTVFDYLWIGCKLYNSYGPVAYGVDWEGQRRVLQNQASFPVDYMRVYARNKSFSLICPGYEETLELPYLGTPVPTPFNIRIYGEGKEFDMVAYWWCDEVRNMYFMVQPMLSEAGTCALFTHGYNIFTEI